VSDIVQDVIWVVLLSAGLYTFLWGDGIERSIDMSEKVFPSKKPRESRQVTARRARALVWLMAVFFVMVTLIRFRNHYLVD
jgi:hypothetical protein